MLQPTELLLIRHAQSANNAQPEHLRVPDPDLTGVGSQQSELLAEALLSRNKSGWTSSATPSLSPPAVSHLYCSPFLRALLTIAPIQARCKLVPRVLPELCEQGGCYAGYLPGKLTPQPGLSRRSIETRFGNWNLAPTITDRGWWFADQYESMDQARARARKVARWLESEIAPQHGCHAMVIHADFKRLLVAELLQQSPDALDEPWNASMTSLQWHQHRWELIAYNQIDHLPEDLRSL